MFGTVGPSLEPSGINMIDCVRVYCKTKDSFGWPAESLVPIHHKSSSIIVDNAIEIVQLHDGVKSLELLDR